MTYTFDPEVAAALPYAPVLDVSDVPGARKVIADLGAALPPWQPDPSTSYEVRTIPEGDDLPEVELHLVRPAGSEALRGALLWFHGGGFVMGDARESLPFLSAIALQANIVAVSVQYRLAPETPFPGAADDAFAAWQWLSRAESWGFGADRIAIGGQSAGGAIAAGLALKLRDLGEPLLYQALDIPVLDDRAETQSATDYVNTPVWHRRNVEASWHAYLGDVDRPTSAYAAPARAADLRGLPATIVTVSQLDPLRDEGIEYARRLAHAGVPVDLHMYAGTFHGSAAIAAEAQVSRRQDAELRHALDQAFGRFVATQGE